MTTPEGRDRSRIFAVMALLAAVALVTLARLQQGVGS